MSDARRAALSALIDHAPTFPPASLSTPDALDEDRRARTGEHAWMLARLVWPASRLDELEGEDRALSVVLDAPYEGDLRAEAVETRWDAGLNGLGGEAYVELPLGDGLEERIAVLAERGLRAKVRCGGAEVPTVQRARPFPLGVPCSRRPVQGDRRPAPSPGRRRRSRLPQRDCGLCVRRCRSVERDGPARPRGSALARPQSPAPDELERVRREQLVAVGSCSFSEPVDDLKQLGVL